MAAIHDLIAQIEDQTLRLRLLDELYRITKEKKFGLVFEDHLPELTPLYSAKVVRGSHVARKDGPLADIWRVISVNKTEAQCIQRATGVQKKMAANDLIVVRQFGEPIFPSLVPVDRVSNGADDAPWHTLIEADNYHALQLLEYLYSGQVDCIYIDPPYNNGARVWKYNNDYVDANDNWRHSKWLAMMRRRLKLAKRLLNPLDSTLIVAIDDNEIFTLGLLLDEVFKDCERQIVSVTINPKGKARDGRLSQVDEYLIIIYLGAAKSQELSTDISEVEVRWPYLRRSDVESARGTKKGGARQFYPIYVNEKNQNIVAIGEPISPLQPLTDAPVLKGAIPVFPIRDDGKQMNWGLTGPSLRKAVDLGFVRVMKSSNVHQPYNFSYLTVPSIKKVEDGIYRVSSVRDDGTKVVVIPGGKAQRGTTAWKKNLHDANAYGSQIVSDFVQDVKFPFPKSLYAVFDTLQLFLANKPNALLVDFFAGSGTTLHALNLLNAMDGNHRQCILVTNNEVSEDDAKLLTKSGLYPGQADWERQGICQSVTWPRSKYSILGRRENGSAIKGDYFTGNTEQKEKERRIVQIGFVDQERLTSAAIKKQLVALIDGLPQSAIKRDTRFFVLPDYKSSILFDESAADEWLSALEGQDHVTEFYIVTTSQNLFDDLKASITNLLGPVLVSEDGKRLIRDGFSANLEYFRLDFLDKDHVALKRRFRELLPILWLRAGAVGLRPDLPNNTPEPEWLLPVHNPFAVLVDERRFGAFLEAISCRDDLTHIFLVTDSEDAFQEMAAQIKAPNVFQLYRDYLENFMINKGDEA